LNEFDLVSFMLARLRSDYDSFVTSVTTRVDPISLEELYGLLHAHENRLEQNNSSLNFDVSGVNFAPRRYPS
jgi:hypothetical protein